MDNFRSEGSGRSFQRSLHFLKDLRKNRNDDSTETFPSSTDYCKASEFGRKGSGIVCQESKKNDNDSESGRFDDDTYFRPAKRNYERERTDARNFNDDTYFLPARRNYDREKEYGKEKSGNGQRTFKTLKDGTEFYYPLLPWHIKRDEPMLNEFKDNIRCLGSYCEDENKDFNNDKAYISFLNTEEYLPDDFTREKQVMLDLATTDEKNQGYTGTPIKGLHNFLSWIINNEEICKEHFKTETKGGQFICSRNVLSQIFKIPFSIKHKYHINAVCFDGNIYLLKNFDKSEEKKETDKSSMWANKFKQNLIIGEDTEEGIACESGFRSVLTSNLGSHKMLYCSSVDCFNPGLYMENMTDLSAGILLKCVYEIPHTPIMFYTERFRMIDWSIELALTGIPEVLAGYRSGEGVVETLKLYDAETLQRKGKEFWNLRTSVTFANEFLCYIKTITEREPETVFLFKKDEYKSCFEMKEVDQEDFLPYWFVKELKKMKTKM